MSSSSATRRGDPAPTNFHTVHVGKVRFSKATVSSASVKLSAQDAFNLSSSTHKSGIECYPRSLSFGSAIQHVAGHEQFYNFVSTYSIHLSSIRSYFKIDYLPLEYKDLHLVTISSHAILPQSYTHAKAFR